MKPKTKLESYWRMFGREYRHIFKIGNTARFRNQRRFTRKRCNRAMRKHGKDEIEEQLGELD